MKKLSGILFDFNGTLFFDSKIHFEAFRKMCIDYGVPVMSDSYLIDNVFGRSNEQICKSFFKPDATPSECDEFDKRKISAYFNTCLSRPEILKLVDGVCEMLDYLKSKSIPYCMATGSGKQEVDFYIEHLGISRWFSYDNIVYTDGTFNGKPAPDCYILAARRIALSPSDCIVFEDGLSGIRAAKAAGAGAVIAVHERETPSPIAGDVRVDGEYYSFADWRSILSEYGL